MKTRTYTGYFVKKPNPNCAVEAASSDYLLAHAPDVIWEKTRLDGGKVYNRLHQSWIEFNFGDVFNVSNLVDVYPIDRAVFEATYEDVNEAV